MKYTTRTPESISNISKSIPPNLNGPEREVKIGYRPIGGRAVAWTVGLVHSWLRRGAHLPDGEDVLPDPHFHWCVLVGEYYHQMQITDGLVWYSNDEVSWKDGWSIFDVGTTKFNDVAIAEAGMKTIAGMPEYYNMWTNNCHHFTLKLIDIICATGRKKTIVKTSRRHRRSSSMQFSEDEAKGVRDCFKQVAERVSLESKCPFVVEETEEDCERAFAEDGNGQHSRVLRRAGSILEENTPNVTADKLVGVASAGARHAVGQRQSH